MTERFNTLTVVLETDVREDDAEGLLAAISRLRGVLSVKGNVADIDAFLAEQRARSDLEQKLWAVIYPKDKDK